MPRFSAYDANLRFAACTQVSAYDALVRQIMDELDRAEATLLSDLNKPLWSRFRRDYSIIWPEPMPRIGAIERKVRAKYEFWRTRVKDVIDVARYGPREYEEW